jgi:hypothetical protein
MFTRVRRLLLLILILLGAYSATPVQKGMVVAECRLCSTDFVCPEDPNVLCGENGASTCYCKPYGGPTSYRCVLGRK